MDELAVELVRVGTEICAYLKGRQPIIEGLYRYECRSGHKDEIGYELIDKIALKVGKLFSGTLYSKRILISDGREIDGFKEDNDNTFLGVSVTLGEYILMTDEDLNEVEKDFEERCHAYCFQH